jgi:amphi-Trp domain-containing protein
MSEILEIEDEREVQREQAAAMLHRIADSLARHNDIEFKRDGRQYRVRVPDQVTIEFELEIDDDASSLEIEISW